METKRITLFAGHYGSGKTNIAINYALYLKKLHDRVLIVDLDIVNPYFRTKDNEKVLTEAGVRTISSKYANTNVDVPALPPEAYAIVKDRSSHAVADIGGDDRGALALGRYSDMILEENNYGMMLVINKYRPLTHDGKSALEVIKEIEAASKIPFTAIINNSNLGEDTGPETLIESQGYAKEISELSGLPVYFTAVREDLCGSLEGYMDPIFPIKIYQKPIWVI